MDWKSLFTGVEEQALDFFLPECCEGSTMVTPPTAVFDEGISKWKNWVLENGPWHIQHKPLGLRKWKPNLAILDFELAKMSVWVQFFNVHLELLSKKMLSYIASALGVPLYMDTITAFKECLEFAKAQVFAQNKETNYGAKGEVVVIANAVKLCQEMIVVVSEKNKAEKVETSMASDFPPLKYFTQMKKGRRNKEDKGRGMMSTIKIRTYMSRSKSMSLDKIISIEHVTPSSLLSDALDLKFIDSNKEHFPIAKGGERKFQGMGDDSLQRSLAWLHDVLQGKIGHGYDTRVLEGLRVVHAQKRFIRFDLIVPNVVSDVDGNWHVGALASLLDILGAVTIFSFANRVISTVDFNVSYYSTAKIQEHVEIESKVTANKGRLIHVVVEAKRKANGEVIAVGKQWMASNKLTVSQASNIGQHKSCLTKDFH
ncbi:acyl-CoA synthetase family member 3 [Hibiscus syriacus]|uniref:Acyl-CoA synthetase family member 3 n=1 Tax=Hibiscus syriacus TaxID=106335 RepID=A0A6A3D3U8_HIBSY|nr:acyl-CoA synthetase family member 3 [Hibiscus syriacus]